MRGSGGEGNPLLFLFDAVLRHLGSSGDAGREAGRTGGRGACFMGVGGATRRTRRGQLWGAGNGGGELVSGVVRVSRGLGCYCNRYSARVS